MRLVKLIYLSAPSTTQSWGTKITKKKALGGPIRRRNQCGSEQGERTWSRGSLLRGGQFSFFFFNFIFYMKT